MMRAPALLLAECAVLAAARVHAQMAPDFYKGKQITMLVSTAAGGALSNASGAHR